jgi:hypothetical protein
MTSRNKFYSSLFSLVLFALPNNGNAATQKEYGFNSNRQRTISYGNFNIADSSNTSISGPIVAKNDIDECSQITPNVIDMLELWDRVNEAMEKELEQEREWRSNPQVFLNILFHYELTADGIETLNKKLDSFPKWVCIGYEAPGLSYRRRGGE